MITLALGPVVTPPVIVTPQLVLAAILPLVAVRIRDAATVPDADEEAAQFKVLHPKTEPKVKVPNVISGRLRLTMSLVFKGASEVNVNVMVDADIVLGVAMVS